MSEQEKQGWWERSLSRRTVLKGAAAGIALATVQSAFQRDVLAQQRVLDEGLQFFNDVQAMTVIAIAERIWPATDESPGATDAGVVYYIDRALAGPYREDQRTYRVGLTAIDEVARRRNGGQPFRTLGGEAQDEILRMMEEGADLFATNGEAATAEEGEDQEEDAREGVAPIPAPDDGEQPALGRPDLQDFFDTIRTHTMQGLFADPIYGGNRNFAGWRAVGYPGAYYLYTAEEQQSFEPLDKPFQSVADL